MIPAVIHRGSPCCPLAVHKRLCVASSGEGNAPACVTTRGLARPSTDENGRSDMTDRTTGAGGAQGAVLRPGGR